jgi:hypothetical protein
MKRNRPYSGYWFCCFAFWCTISESASVCLSCSWFPIFLEPDLVQIIPLQLASLRNKFTCFPDHIISACSKIKSLREECRETRVERFRKEKCKLSPSSSSSNTQLDCFSQPIELRVPMCCEKCMKKVTEKLLDLSGRKPFHMLLLRVMTLLQDLVIIGHLQRTWTLE